MLPLLRTLTFRYLGQRPARAVLIILSIALGVAALVATRALNQTMGRAAQGAMTPFVQLGDLVVVNGQAGLPGTVAADLRKAKIEGLKEVCPLVFGRASLVLPGDEAGKPRFLTAPFVGVPIDLARDSGVPLPEVTIQWTYTAADLRGLLLSDAVEMLGMRLSKPVVVGADLRGRLPAAHGKPEPFQVRLSGRTLQLLPVGTAHVRGDLATLGNDSLFLRLEDAAALANPHRPNYVSRINLSLAAGADAEQVRRRVQEVVGSRGEVRTAAQNSESALGVASGLELGVKLGGVGALLIGLFLVYNILSVSVAERRRDIGIFRSMGATRGQIVRLFVTEATLLGLAGSALGLPLGLGLAWLSLAYLTTVVSNTFGVALPAQALHVAPASLGLALGAGVLTAVVAAVVPALQAALEDPAQAVRRVPRGARVGFLLLQGGVAVLLVVVGVAAVVWRERLGLGLAGAFTGFVCWLLAALVAAPVLAALLGRLGQPLFRHVFAVAGRLAADNLVRSPGRTGLVVAALAATGSLLLTTAGFLHSTEQTMSQWLEEKVGADLFLTGGGGLDNATQQVPVSEKRGTDLAGAFPDEVDVVMAVRAYYLDFRKQMVFLLALDADAFERSSPDGRPPRSELALARSLARFPRLRKPGTALVSENFAALFGVKVGEHLSIPGPAGPMDLEVVGTAVDYSWPRGTIIVDRRWFRKRFADTQVDVFDVFLRHPGDAAAMKQKLQQWGRNDALVVETRAEARRELADTLQQIYSLAYAQQFVIGMVALLGVTGALSISVLQRTRELGLLRAVGATLAQVLRSVLAEATLMGILGALIGFGLGVVLEWYTLEVLIPDDSGWLFPLRVPWLAAGLVLGLTVLLATLAGLAPAVQAMRLNISEAIAYE
jgi:putative ABC transport system permease protein